jgi:hypothetical protein
MNISEFFDSRKRDSAAAVEELQKHLETWPEVEAEFKRQDVDVCIPLAGKLASARLAASPTTITIEAELKRARWDRDRAKQNFSIRRAELMRMVESCTRPLIDGFHEECLARVKRLSSKYNFEILENSHDLEGRRRRQTVRVSHNAAALDAAKDRIFAGMREVRDMNLSSLAVLENRIGQLRAEFDNFDFTTLQIEEVDEDTAKSMRPQKPESDDLQSAYIIGPDKKDHILINKDAGRINDLKNRITKLEGI